MLKWTFIFLAVALVEVAGRLAAESDQRSVTIREEE